MSTGPDGKGIFPRRDGTVKCNARDFLDGTGRHELTVGEIVDGAGRDYVRFVKIYEYQRNNIYTVLMVHTGRTSARIIATSTLIILCRICCYNGMALVFTTGHLLPEVFIFCKVTIQSTRVQSPM